MPIPPPFIPYPREHKAQQAAARDAAGDTWQEHHLVFTRERFLANTFGSQAWLWDTPDALRLDPDSRNPSHAFRRG